MQFARVGKDSFHVEFRAPITAIQAFGIALAVFKAGGASKKKVVFEAPQQDEVEEPAVEVS